MDSSNNQKSPSEAADTHQSRLFDELQWVIRIRHSLEDDDDDDTGIPVSVFNVPKYLQVTKPEAYVPQLIALGPFHRWRPELYDMERYKLAAARRTQKHFHATTLPNLVDQFIKHENKIRAHYHRYLDFGGETLAWMMAVDASFLLEFLHVYAIDEGKGPKVLTRLSSRMLHLMDYTGRKSAHNVILRDIMMLENQIPLLLVRKILELQSPSVEAADASLGKMLAGLLNELSPFKLMDNFLCIDVTQHSHLLEILYYALVPKSDDQQTDYSEIEVQDDEHAATKEQVPADSGYVKQFCDAAWKMGSNLNGAPIQFIKGVIVSRPVKLIAQVPWSILSSLPGLSILKKPEESLFSSQGGEEGGKLEKLFPRALLDLSAINRPPRAEEIMIPSVTELAGACMNISPTTGDLSTIAFDDKTVTLYLPAVSLDVNTDVVLRNLVAYEAAAATGPLVFTRYTELMNGIVNTEEDVKLLRERGVIINRLKSDEEAAKMWNGISRCVRLTKVAHLDKVIEDVNRYYGSRWSVKTGRFMKRYVFGSWQFLTFLAAILLLLLTGLQAFCSVYTCSRWFGGGVSLPQSHP